MGQHDLFAAERPRESTARLDRAVDLIFVTVLALNYLGDVVRAAVRRPREPRYEDCAAGRSRPTGSPTHRSTDRCSRSTDVRTHFKTPRGLVHAVDGVSFTLERGKTIGIVGESGCGKSVLSRSIMGLLPSNAVRHGSILFEGHEIGESRGRRDARLLGHSDGDGVPGPDDVAEPGHARRQRRSPSRCASTSTSRRTTPTRPRCAAEVGRDSGGRTAAARSTRTNCREACASA